jgi:hypothetical protein
MGFPNRFENVGEAIGKPALIGMRESVSSKIVWIRTPVLTQPAWPGHQPILQR